MRITGRTNECTLCHGLGVEIIVHRSSNFVVHLDRDTIQPNQRLEGIGCVHNDGCRPQARLDPILRQANVFYRRYVDLCRVAKLLLLNRAACDSVFFLATAKRK